MAVALGVALALGLVAGVPTPAAAQDDAATDQRVVRLVGNYDAYPGEGRIDVVEQITVSNVRGSTRSGNTVTSYFWTGHTVWAPADAEDLSISVDGTELEWEVFDTISGIDIISADYRRNLNFGQTRVIDVTYSLPTYGPDEGGRRLNDALFFFDLVTCCGFEEIDLTVTMPTDFEVTPPRNMGFVRSGSGARQTFTFTDNEITGDFTELIFTDWSGFSEAGLERASVDLGQGASLELVHPPDDAEWAAETSDELVGLAATLGELTGQPFPVDELVLRQGRVDDAGLWSPPESLDEPVIIARARNREVLAALLADGWLSAGPFAEGPVRDGLASVFAAEAVAAAGGRPSTPSIPSGGGELDREDAHWVLAQVADEVGVDGLTEIVARAAAGETAYPGAGDATDPAAPTTGAPAAGGDWRTFVDLAERQVGSTEVATLFADHVVDDAGRDELAARGEALTGMAELSDSTDGVVPAGVLGAMAAWEFDRAERLLAAADEVVDERDRVIADRPDRADDEGLAIGSAFAEAETVDDLEAIRTGIVDREAELDRDRLVRFGLIGGGALLALVVLAFGAVLVRRRGRPSTGAPAPDPDWAPPTVVPSDTTPPVALPEGTTPDVVVDPPVTPPPASPWLPVSPGGAGADATIEVPSPSAATPPPASQPEQDQPASH
ncbi:MAG: hypothetical protein AAGA93_11370 [Actinomycetota bacterium]